MQPINKITFRNIGVSLVVDEFMKRFAEKKIYSMGDIYSSYHQF